MKTIEHVKRDTQKSAEPLKEKVSAHMEKTVHNTTKIAKEIMVKEKQSENIVKDKEATVIK